MENVKTKMYEKVTVETQLLSCIIGMESCV